MIFLKNETNQGYGYEIPDDGWRPFELQPVEPRPQQRGGWKRTYPPAPVEDDNTTQDTTETEVFKARRVPVTSGKLGRMIRGGGR